jgi:ABC-type uncharacterized transport system substrate-binding protein
MNAGKIAIRLLGVVGAAGLISAGSATAQAPVKTFKVLHIMSYHSPFAWTDGQLDGFKEALEGVPAEYKVFQLDTKRHSSPAEKEGKGKEARALIESWKPDLVYTSDDDAQEYVAKYYVNKNLPFVFSGVNKDPKAYGFEGSKNVTGIMEREHIIESVKLLKAIAPKTRRLVAVFDDAVMWQPVIARMRAELAQVPDIKIVAWDTIYTYEEYKRKIKEYPTKADAIALIGVFNFKDGAGKNVPYEEVLKWTAENSALPDLSYWAVRVDNGTLCSVTVSAREQGLAAGNMARAILVEGKSPSAFQMQPTLKGAPVISLARANALGIKLKSGLLLSSQIVTKFDWDKK